jgi:hypothetical protein
MLRKKAHTESYLGIFAVSGRFIRHLKQQSVVVIATNYI